MTKQERMEEFRTHIQDTYGNTEFSYNLELDFGVILCYEIHSQPVNPRMEIKTRNNGFETGLCFNELAAKWGISITFLGELIADHCKKLDG